MLVKALGLAIREKQEEIVKMITAAGADVKELFLTVRTEDMRCFLCSSILPVILDICDHCAI